MDYIYSRVSTDDQTVSGQLHKLKQLYPNAEIVEETISGYVEKPVLNALLVRLQRGDVLIVAALDRLGRHTMKALTLIENLNKRGISLISIREGLDMTTSTGKFVATMMLGLAEMERNLISERTKAALAALKAKGVQLGRKKGAPIKNIKPLGRKPKYKPEAVSMVFEYRKKGLTIKEIHQLTNISTGRICQLLKAS